MESSDEMGTSTNHTLVQTLKKDDSQLFLPKIQNVSVLLLSEAPSTGKYVFCVFKKSGVFGWKDSKGQAFAPKVATNSSNFIIKC